MFRALAIFASSRADLVPSSFRALRQDWCRPKNSHNCLKLEASSKIHIGDHRFEAGYPREASGPASYQIRYTTQSILIPETVPPYVPPNCAAWRPIGVDCAKRRAENTRLMIMNGTGRPNIFPLFEQPKFEMLGDHYRLPLGNQQRNTAGDLIIPNVTTNAGRPSLLIRNPFKSPIARPVRSAPRMASKG